MRLESIPDYFEVVKTEITPHDSPRPGDTRLEATFQAHGFSGAASCWVEEHSFNVFHDAVAKLYSDFKGVAVLESISPEEFSLILSPANSRGYVQVKVSLGKLSPPCAISGAFEVPLHDISSVVQWAASSCIDA